MIRFFPLLKRNEDGATTIEFTIVMLLFFTLTFGITEFGYLLWQYNSAAKAAQVGARVAAVSNPIWSALPDLTDDAGSPGGVWLTDYAVECSRNDTDCVSVGDDEVDLGDGYSADAMNCLVFGRQAGEDLCKTACADDPPTDEQGMCNYFHRIATDEDANVVVTYSHTGMGFSGRPGGPVPTITLQLTGLTFEFFALGGLMGFDEITMPDFKVTMTGEDLNAAAP
jgi:hypothetical protein